MKLDLSELLREVGKTADIKESEVVSYPEDNLILTQPVEMKLHLLNAGETVLMDGSVKTEVELECGRCLNKFPAPLVVSIDEEFNKTIPQPEGKRKKERELHAEDFVSSIESDDTLDISEIVRQNLLLALPIKPLCSENCPGQKG